MALTPTDKLLAAWVTFVTAVILLRPPVWASDTAWLLGAHALFGVLLWLFHYGRTAERQDGRLLTVLHTFYPLILLPLLYAELGVINDRLALDAILAHDHVVQGWELALFGEQVSFTWIRRYPSLFWSQILHGAYLFYYPIIFAGPPLVRLHNGREAVREVIFTMMLTFAVCYGVFLLWPVAGPSYAFPHPDGPVMQVFMARLVYGGLATGSSVGAAFPSSHVAATVAVTIAIWRVWPRLGMVFVVPALLLSIGTVYTQMHYGVDALAGLVVGVGVAMVAGSVRRWIERVERTDVERKKVEQNGVEQRRGGALGDVER